MLALNWKDYKEISVHQKYVPNPLSIRQDKRKLWWDWKHKNKIKVVESCLEGSLLNSCMDWVEMMSCWGKCCWSWPGFIIVRKIKIKDWRVSWQGWCKRWKKLRRTIDRKRKSCREWKYKSNNKKSKHNSNLFLFYKK